MITDAALPWVLGLGTLAATLLGALIGAGLARLIDRAERRRGA
ncbi:MAG TPA: hypothetical protein VOB72_04195 [Candidatus Dormibacteraeota bacterium]|nr:hypothetical protein [Candidatus Dormibacteraeota bacterium]